MVTAAEISAIVTVASGVAGFGIAIGKLLSDVSFIKKEVAFLKTKVMELEKRLSAVEKDQLEMKLILRQIAKKLKISY